MPIRAGWFAWFIAILVHTAGCGTTGGSGAAAPVSPPTPAATSPAATSSAAHPNASPPSTASLYDRLGGKLAITAVVDEFVARVAADKRINLRFINTDIPQLKVYLVDFICAATGGPCKYEGRDMHSAHAGMQLVDEEFTALVEALVGGLNKYKVGKREQDEILGALGPLKPDIVEPPAPELQAHDPELVKAAAEQVRALRASEHTRAADLLEGAVKARVRGQRNWAEILFSAAERESGRASIPELDALFRVGSPARITTALTTMPKDTPAQPKGAVGGSEQDDPDAVPSTDRCQARCTVMGRASCPRR